MKTKVLLLLTLLFNVNTYAQFEEQQIISTEAAGIWQVTGADIDGDGDLDVISACGDDDKVAWYENTDGLGSFDIEHIVTTNANEADDVFAADIDGDDDIDLVVSSAVDNKISWHENTDGLGTFTEHVITTFAAYAVSVFAADIDGDGDMDVLSSSWNDDKVSWYENTDGLGDFGPQINIIEEIDASKIFCADFDGDGDTDLLFTSYPENKIIWMENTDGLGNFGEQQIITDLAENAQTVFAADIDGDGDMDALSASTADDKIAWYENTDGLGNFGEQQVITFNAIGAVRVFAADLDNDGDIDVLSASQYDDKIAWYENTDGLGDFGEQQIISTNTLRAVSVFAGDIDGDGDTDVVSASHDDNKVAWFENSTITIGIDENELLSFSVYPNPTSDILTIQSGTTFTRIEIYNQAGQLIISKSNLDKIDVSELNQGLYFIKVIDEEGNFGISKIVKK